MNAPGVLDLLGLDEGMLTGFAPVTPLAALAAAMCIGRYALSLEDQKMLTEMTGLDAQAPVQATADDGPQPRVKPDTYRRGKRGQH
jgi:hypothetical protein